MKKTLFALLACATLAAPAMAKSWSIDYSYAGVYNNDRTEENYTFYTFYLDTANITTTIQNNTLAEFKTTYGEGYSCTGDLENQLAFVVGTTVTTPTTEPDNIWGVVVYQNGDDALFSALAPSDVFMNRVQFDYYDGENGYVAFKADSPTTPEPATATLSLLALAGLATRRRRK